MYQLEIKRFLFSKGILGALLALLAVGVLSLHIGQQFVQKQTQAEAAIARFQAEHIERNVQFFDKEMGLLLYYLRFTLVNSTHPLNGLSIGQRDINSSIQSLTIRGLENQKYDTDLHNPLNLLLGNLDFSFVLVYLFPLLIIVLCYNLLAEEREGGTLRLLASQTDHVLLFLLRKMSIRVLAIGLCLLLLFGYTFYLFRLPWDNATLAFGALAFMYVLFWFSLSTWVISWQRSSGFNAAVLLSFWVLLTILAPTGINAYLINRYPVPEALSVMVQQREGYHEKWDLDKSMTMNKFYAHYPQFKSFPLPDKTFSWLWYYAMQQMGDDESKEAVLDLKNKLKLREKQSRNLAYFCPPIHAQLSLNQLAGADLHNHLQFLEATEHFHEKKRLYFYPRIFAEQPVRSENWKAFKVKKFLSAVRIHWWSNLAPLLLLSGVLIVLGFRGLRVIKLEN
jgi:ABC-2 type transport system permease protein